MDVDVEGVKRLPDALRLSFFFTFNLDPGTTVESFIQYPSAWPHGWSVWNTGIEWM